jgi:hypothetical protein
LGRNKKTSKVGKFISSNHLTEQKILLTTKSMKNTKKKKLNFISFMLFMVKYNKPERVVNRL